MYTAHLRRHHQQTHTSKLENFSFGEFGQKYVFSPKLKFPNLLVCVCWWWRRRWAVYIENSSDLKRSRRVDAPGIF